MNRTINNILSTSLILLFFVCCTLHVIAQSGQENPKIKFTPSVEVLDNCTFNGQLTIE